jgi:hypothetical protein
MLDHAFIQDLKDRFPVKGLRKVVGKAGVAELRDRFLFRAPGESNQGNYRPFSPESSDFLGARDSIHSWTLDIQKDSVITLARDPIQSTRKVLDLIQQVLGSVQTHAHERSNIR